MFQELLLSNSNTFSFLIRGIIVNKHKPIIKRHTRTKQSILHICTLFYQFFSLTISNLLSVTLIFCLLAMACESSKTFGVN